MFCEVCGTIVSAANSLSVLEKTMASSVPMIFKLFQTLQRELSFSGFLCYQCRDLCEKLDLLESQLKEVKETLENRDFKHSSNQESKSDEPFVDSTPLSSAEFDEYSPCSEFWKDISQGLDCVDKYLGRVDTEFIITKTQRKEESLLVYKGQKFRKLRFSDNDPDGQGIVKWRCAKHHLKENPCRAKVATTNDGLFLLLDSYTKHNHAPNFSSCDSVLLRERIKTIVLNHPNMKTNEILSSADMLDYAASAKNASKKLKDDKSLHRYVQRIRAKHKIQNKGEIGK